MAKELVIQGRAPGSTHWGVVNALRQENAIAWEKNDLDLVMDLAYVRLQEWQNAAGDFRGAFRGWEFRLQVVQPPIITSKRKMAA